MTQNPHDARQRAFQLLNEDLPTYSKFCLKIRDKQGRIVPLVYNKAQLYCHQKLEEQKAKQSFIRAVIMKGRQEGMTTYIESRFFKQTSMGRGVASFILSHEAKSTDAIFSMVKRFNDHLPPGMAPALATANKNQLRFAGSDSEYTVGTAGSEDVGRSMTIKLLHMCLEENTWVYTPGGLKRIKEIVVGDVVYTHGKETAIVSAVSSQVKECHEVRISSMMSLPVFATKEHRFYTQQKRRRYFTPLSELSVGDWIGYPIPKFTGREAFWGVMALTFNFGRVVGLYFAEGSLKNQHKEPHNLCSVVFTVHEKEVVRTLEWLRPFEGFYKSVRVHRRKGSKTCNVVVHGKKFAEGIDKYCGRAKSKGFSVGDWKQHPKEFLKGVLVGYLAGDGSFDSNARMIQASAVYENLTLIMRDIAVGLGYGWASIDYTPAGVYHGRNCKEQFTFRLSGLGAQDLALFIWGKNKPYLRKSSKPKYRISQGYVWNKISSISKEAKTCRVCDLEVLHKNQSYLLVQGAVHNSEVAFYEHTDELETGLMQAVADLPGTEIILESTANGIGNMFHEAAMKAMAGTSLYQLIFIPWYWMDEYRLAPPEGFAPEQDELLLMKTYGLDLEQIYWRRMKIAGMKGGLAKFQQEYPFTPEEAFLMSGETFYSKESIVAARKCSNTSPGAPKIMGIDCGRNNDRSVFLIRQGRAVLHYEVHRDLRAEGREPTQQLITIAANLINRHGVDKCFIDFGYGHGLVDGLLTLGYRKIVVGVNFQQQPLDKQYLNKRAEMHGLARDWLEEGEVSIPDDDIFAFDLLLIPKEKQTPTHRVFLIKKSEIKEKAKVSPDINDAFVLTFAFPVAYNPDEFGSAPRARKPRNVSREKSSLSTVNRMRRAR